MKLAKRLMRRLSGGGSIPTDGLLFLYDCESNASNIMVDASGNSSNGSIFGSSIVPGKISNALMFNGTTSHGAATSHMKNISTGFSLSLWVNMTIRTNSYDCLWMMDTLSSSTRMRIFNYSSSLQGMSFQVGPTIINDTGGQNPSGITHILAQYNATTGLVELYFNNQLIDSGITTTGLSTPNMTAQIGKAQSNTASQPNQSISGWIDQVRFYDRPVTSDERTALYEEAV